MNQTFSAVLTIVLPTLTGAAVAGATWKLLLALLDTPREKQTNVPIAAPTRTPPAGFGTPPPDHQADSAFPEPSRIAQSGDAQIAYMEKWEFDKWKKQNDKAGNDFEDRLGAFEKRVASAERSVTESKSAADKSIRDAAAVLSEKLNDQEVSFLDKQRTLQVEIRTSTAPIAELRTWLERIDSTLAAEREQNVTVQQRSNDTLRSVSDQLNSLQSQLELLARKFDVPLESLTRGQRSDVQEPARSALPKRSRKLDQLPKGPQVVRLLSPEDMFGRKGKDVGSLDILLNFEDKKLLVRKMKINRCELAPAEWTAFLVYLGCAKNLPRIDGKAVFVECDVEFANAVVLDLSEDELENCAEELLANTLSLNRLPIRKNPLLQEKQLKFSFDPLPTEVSVNIRNQSGAR